MSFGDWLDGFAPFVVAGGAARMWATRDDDEEGQEKGTPLADPHDPTSGAPTVGATADTPRPLGYETTPGFDPDRDAPMVKEGGRTAKGRITYYEGMESSWWSGKGDKQVNAMKSALYEAGYYGKTLPAMTGMTSTADADALKKAMADANHNGVDLDMYLTRVGTVNSPTAGGASAADGRAQAQQLRAEYASGVQMVRRWAYDNGVRLPEEFVARKAAQLAKGSTSAEQLTQQMNDRFVGKLYPTLKADVDAGMTVRDAAAPYTATVAAMLGVPEQQVDLQDPLVKRALQNVNDKGEPAYMPMWKFEEEIRKDKRWQYSDDAWETVGAKAFGVMEMFGMQPGGAV